MGLLDFIKGKKTPIERRTEVPPAPPTAEELPELPSPKEIEKIEITKEVEEPMIEQIEKAAVRSQQEELEEREELIIKKPIFMPLELFRDLLDEVQLIAHTLKENQDILVRVSHFKEDQDKEFKKWETQVNDIQKKLIYADKTLFG